MDPSPSPPWIAPFFLAHAGCPHRCVFCNQAMISGTASPPSPFQVREVLKSFRPSRGPGENRRRQIAFYGGSFTCMPAERQEAYLEVCRPYLRGGLVDSIRVSTRPDAISAGQCAFLADRGVQTVELGVQSLSDRVLRASRRGHTGETSRQAVLRVRDMGLETGVQIMVGLPEDTGEESLETAEELAGLKPDFVRIYPLLVLRETELAGRMKRSAYEPLDVDRAVSLCADMLQMFEEASIPVVRIGLQEHAGMGRTGSEGNHVLAGPYHPAFGHLVRSALFLRRALASLPGPMPAASGVCLRIHPHDRPLLAGDRGKNLSKLRNVLDHRELRIEGDPGLRRGTVRWEVKGER